MSTFCRPPHARNLTKSPSSLTMLQRRRRQPRSAQRLARSVSRPALVLKALLAQSRSTAPLRVAFRAVWRAWPRSSSRRLQLRPVPESPHRRVAEGWEPLAPCRLPWLRLVFSVAWCFLSLVYILHIAFDLGRLVLIVVARDSSLHSQSVAATRLLSTSSLFQPK